MRPDGQRRTCCMRPQWSWTTWARECASERVSHFKIYGKGLVIAGCLIDLDDAAWCETKDALAEQQLRTSAIPHPIIVRWYSGKAVATLLRCRLWQQPATTWPLQSHGGSRRDMIPSAALQLCTASCSFGLTTLLANASSRPIQHFASIITAEICLRCQVADRCFGSLIKHGSSSGGN